MTKSLRIIAGLIGFLLSAALAFTIEVAFAEWANISPRGLGWLALPIFSGVVGWRLSYHADLIVSSSANSWLVSLQTQNGRAFLLGIVGWLVGWTFLAFTSSVISEDSWWSDRDWTRFYQWLIGGPVLIIAGMICINWVRQGRKN